MYEYLKNQNIIEVILKNGVKKSGKIKALKAGVKISIGSNSSYFSKGNTHFIFIPYENIMEYYTD